MRMKLDKYSIMFKMSILNRNYRFKLKKIFLAKWLKKINNTNQTKLWRF